MAKKNKKCLTCGTKYGYCPSCSEDKNKPTYMNTYCSESCMKLFTAASDYYAKVIDKAEARKLIDGCDLTKDTYKDSIKKFIKEVTEDNVVETKEKVETKVETKETKVETKVNDTKAETVKAETKVEEKKDNKTTTYVDKKKFNKRK